MRKSIIIGKRQIILAGLIVALGAAVFLNYQFASSTSVNELTVSSGTTETTSQKNMGDTEYVSTSAVAEGVNSVPGAADDIINNAKVDRDNARKDAVATYNQILNDTNADKDAKVQATKDAETLAKNIESEGLIETMLATKGFEESIAIINEDNCNVIVESSEDLVASQILQIQDVITTQTDIPLENVQISQVK